MSCNLDDNLRDLTAQFTNASTGQCNSHARAAIRAAFHDCGAWKVGIPGGCDGSLFLAGEYNRAENNGLQDVSQYLGNLAQSNGVGVADLFQFAAVTQGIVICPLGPKVVTFVGRQDSPTAAPEGFLPSPTQSADDLIALFLAKTITAGELVALLGAHTVSTQSFVDPVDAGAAQDTTDGVWDVTYYQETLAGTAPFTFESDTNIANSPVSGLIFRSFANDQVGWNVAFSAAMTKLSLLGVSSALSLIDCTTALPPQKVKRHVGDVKLAPLLRPI